MGVSRGKVVLVGAGPGDPDLLTVKAVRLLERADVVVYDRLVSTAILDLIRPGAECVSVGKEPGNHSISQDEINELLLAYASGGRTVLRLKGGDPLIFGRAGEEISHLTQHGIAVDVVPGITTASAVSSEFLMPLTARGLASGVTFITGSHRANAPLDYDWEALAQSGTTLVVYMGLTNAPEITEQLIAAGLAADTPTAIVENATRDDQRLLVTTLSGLVGAIKAHGFRPPSLIVVGAVAALAVTQRIGASPQPAEARSRTHVA